MKALFLTSAILLASMTASAKSAWTCYGPDNLSVELNEDGSKMQVIIEGEGRGWAKVKQKNQNSDGSVTYISNKGVLNLKSDGKSGDFYWPGDVEANPLKCSATK